MNHLNDSLMHVVTWRLNGAKPTDRLRQADVVVKAFQDLRAVVPGLLRMDVGRNFIETSDAWDVALCMIFASRADLEAYQTHPSHLAIKKLVGPMRMERCQVDFALTP